MKRKMLAIALSVVLLSSLALVGCGSNSTTTAEPSKDGQQAAEKPADEPIKLKYAFFAPANTFPAKQMEKWKEEVEKRTNGKVQVELYPGGTLLDAKNMYDGVKNGVADIGLSATTYEPGRFPLLGISDMPSGYPNAKVASQVVYDLIQQYPPEAFKDYKIITAFATEPAFVQSKKPIKSLEDLKGKQLRISGALTPILQAMGGAPVGMSQAEVPEALQTGVIEGVITSREVLKDFKLAEMIKYVTDYPMTINTFIAVMTKDKWESLPEDVRKVIDELSPEMAKWTGEYLDNHVKESIEWSQKEHGLQIVSLSEEERAKWDQIIKPLQDKYVAELQAKGLPAEEYKKKLYELIEKYSK